MPSKEALRIARKIARNRAKRLQAQLGSGGRICLPATDAQALSGHYSDLDVNRSWVIDSGSCVNLIRTDELTTDEASRIRPVPGGPENLITANGPTMADREVSVRLGSCDYSATALVLDDAPSVLSFGRLIEDGFSFEWKA